MFSIFCSYNFILRLVNFCLSFLNCDLYFLFRVSEKLCSSLQYLNFCNKNENVNQSEKLKDLLWKTMKKKVNRHCYFVC